MQWLAALIARGEWVGAKIWILELPGFGGVSRRDAQVILSGNLVLIEVELMQSPTGDVFQELFVPIRDSLWKLDAENDMTRYAEMAVEQVRMLTGFDRVMMYRFDSNWDGEVIAEATAQQLMMSFERWPDERRVTEVQTGSADPAAPRS